MKNNASGSYALSSQCKHYHGLCQLWKEQKYDDMTADLRLEPGFAVPYLRSDNSSVVTWVVDVRTGNFVYLSNNIRDFIGYEAHDFFSGGLGFLTQIFHPEDMHLTWKNILGTWRHLIDLSHEQRLRFRYSSAYRIYRADGTILYMLEQNSVLKTDCLGNITHFMAVCSDITHLLDNSPANVQQFRVALINKDGSHILSKRELQIVKLLAEGMNSKEISNKLSISFHTVNTHRQKIIKKTGSKSTAGVIRYAAQLQLI